MRDQVARLEHGLALRRVAGQEMKVADRNAALTFRTAHVNGRLERGHRHVHVGRIRRDAMFARAENR